MTDEKSKLTAYILWLMIGPFGAHRFYLGRVKTGILMIVLLVVAVLFMGIGGYLLYQQVQGGTELVGVSDFSAPYLILSSVGYVLFVVWGFWYLLDLLFIHLMIKKDRTNGSVNSEARATEVFR